MVSVKHVSWSGEGDLCFAECQWQAGAEIEAPSAPSEIAGQPVEVWPRVVWAPNWASTFAELKSRIQGQCNISLRSTLVVEAPAALVDGLDLDGALVVEKDSKTKVRDTDTSEANRYKGEKWVQGRETDSMERIRYCTCWYVYAWCSSYRRK